MSIFLFYFLFPGAYILTGVRRSSSVNFNSIGFDFLKEPKATEPLFHSIALQQYILLCAQVLINFNVINVDVPYSLI